MKPREDYFARVRPVIGQGLAGRRVSAHPLDPCARILEWLAGCMLGEIRTAATERAAGRRLAAGLRWKNRFEPARVRVGREADLHLRVRPPEPGQGPGLAFDPAAQTITLVLPEGDLGAWLNLSWAAARHAREILLGRCLWPRGQRFLGSADWPWAESGAPLPPPEPTPPADLDGRHLMIIGLGSVGSEALRLLAAPRARYSLIDPGRVSLFNPPRQWFGSEDLRRPKTACLAERLAPAQVRTIERGFGADDRDDFARLIRADPPDLVLLTAGTADHGPLSEVLWEAGVPHLAACAYPRARYFEVNVALPAEATPCLQCFRGHLWSGPAAAPPLDDELAHFLYQEVAAEERARAWTDLVAEPATAIETGRLVEVTVRAAMEMLAAPAARRPWFTRLLAEGTTCLLGGNAVERVDGQPAYGITRPGQVLRLGLGDVVGTEARRRCPACGRVLDVDQRLALPRADDEAVDAALLG